MTQLVREAIDQTRQLARLEVALARQEIEAGIARAKVGAITLGAAAAAGLWAIAMFLVAVAAAFPTLWLAALVLGAILLALAVVLGLAGWRAMPKHPLSGTRERLETDLKDLKERVA
jgi:Na+/proline symporter